MIKLAGSKYKEFDKKVVLITGGSSGIGLETAKEFTKEGAIVTILDTADKPNFLPAKQFAKANVSNFPDIKTAIDLFVSQFGGLHIVVNNAAKKISGNILNVSSDDFSELLQINGLGYWNVAKATIPYLLKSKGIIINVCSGTTESLPPNTDAYFASKGVSVSLTYSLANSFKDRLRVVGIAPGPVDTPLWRIGQSKEEVEQKLAEGREPIVSSQKIASMILSLASKQNIALNGKIYRYM